MKLKLPGRDFTMSNTADCSRWYYAAMVIDPILRFNWIFYAIPFFTDELQHNTLLGFFVALSEVS